MIEAERLGELACNAGPGVKRLSHRRPCPKPVSDCSPSTAGQWFVSELHIALIHVDRGLKYVSKHRRERVSAIADALAASDHDVITLQELWVFADYEYVRDIISKRLPHSKFFYRCVSMTPSSPARAEEILVAGHWGPAWLYSLDSPLLLPLYTRTR